MSEFTYRSSLRSHVFQTKTIFIHIQDIIKTNILTKKSAPPPGGHVFRATGTIFELVQDIIGTKLPTKFHDDWIINVASRVFTRSEINVASRVLKRFYYSHLEKNAPPLCCHVFQANVTIFDLIQDIIETNLLTKFHEDWTINRVLTRTNAPPPGGHVFKAIKTIFELIQDIIGMNLLTEFHEDWTINVASRVLTRQRLTPHNGQKAIIKDHPEYIVLR
ncbi:hypothetical protein DPMN_014650 [Dreissena polymorpha]|uniref:Uncharacterized protein n=1 Tax=Dreissena polymorpha TaxID=45954 RepID=A0A9D4S4S3_DREPO|nr:hypothetical protein DPMN_014650 [Dreissena polymorpha]